MIMARAGHQPRVNQRIEHRRCKRGGHLGAQIVEDQQIGPLIFADGTLRLGGVGAVKFDGLVAAEHVDGCVVSNRKPGLGHCFGDAGG